MPSAPPAFEITLTTQLEDLPHDILNLCTERCTSLSAICLRNAISPFAKLHSEVECLQEVVTKRVATDDAYASDTLAEFALAHRFDLDLDKLVVNRCVRTFCSMACRAPPDEQPTFFAVTAAHGNVHLLQELRRCGLRWDAQATLAAVAQNQLFALVWLRTRRPPCPWGPICWDHVEAGSTIEKWLAQDPETVLDVGIAFATAFPELTYKHDDSVYDENASALLCVASRPCPRWR